MRLKVFKGWKEEFRPYKVYILDQNHWPFSSVCPFVRQNLGNYKS